MHSDQKQVLLDTPPPLFERIYRRNRKFNIMQTNNDSNPFDRDLI